MRLDSPPLLGHLGGSMRRFCRQFIFTACFALAAAALTLAQGTRGTIRGKVTDPNGAVVSGASVRLIHIARQTEIRSVQTNEDGEYQFL